MSGAAPTLDRVINDKISDYLANLSFCEPATITKVLDNNKVEVRPDLKIQFSESLESKPVITDVPVIQLRSKTAGVSIPVTKGDSCLLLFSERSLDIWLNKGGEVDPKDTRTHSLNDAVALIGLNSFSEFSSNFDPYPDSVTLRNKNTFIRLHPNGKIALGTETVEVINKLSLILDTLANTFVATSLGPQPLSTKAIFEAIKTDIDSIKGTL